MHKAEGSVGHYIAMQVRARGGDRSLRGFLGVNFALKKAMKRAGDKMVFTIERNADVKRAVRAALGRKDVVSMDQACSVAVMMPAQRFWVSEERACAVVSAMMRNISTLDGMRGAKRRMYREIYRRVLMARKQNPEATLVDIVAEVIEQEAPEFYLEPMTARDIIYKSRRA